MTVLPLRQHQFRSYVIRNSRMTKAQLLAYQTLLHQYRIPAAGPLSLVELFTRQAATVLEIGFGAGHSLLAAAKLYPELNFIGVETHQPGIGSLLNGLARENIDNVRIYQGDVMAFLPMLPEASFASVQIFFPDPWPKRKHHPRRLLQATCIELIVAKLQVGGSLHIATDWEDYALQISKILKAQRSLLDLFSGQLTPRSKYRPICSKFEQRAMHEGRGISEFQFAKR